MRYGDELCLSIGDTSFFSSAAQLDTRSAWENTLYVGDLDTLRSETDHTQEDTHRERHWNALEHPSQGADSNEVKSASDGDIDTSDPIFSSSSTSDSPPTTIDSMQQSSPSLPIGSPAPSPFEQPHRYVAFVLWRSKWHVSISNASDHVK